MFRIFGRETSALPYRYPWSRSRASAPITPGDSLKRPIAPPPHPRPRSNRSGVYRYTALAVWLLVSAVMVLDRFFWNVWPRQSICSPGCGSDYFCDMDEDPGCLRRGPWTAKTFDFIARLSARVIISTTSLMFLTMCHGTWNSLSEVSILRPYLHNWREDNYWLHTIGGWTMGGLTIAHVWSLMLPSMFHGYANRAIPGRIDFPAQIPLGTAQIDVDLEEANWGYDDIWRIVWMTIIFGALMPLSRSAWALKNNFSLAMWLHMLAGAGFFIDSARRKTHPHVWILNLPVVLWYILDKFLCAVVLRIDPCAEATRIMLDDQYMLLLWKHDRKPKGMCDIFWVKRGFDRSDPSRSGGEPRRTGELAHPFTTCSSHDVTISTGYTARASSGAVTDVRASIEAPLYTDVAWPGHRFTLTSVLTPNPHCGSNTEPVKPWNAGLYRTPSRQTLRSKGTPSRIEGPSPARARMGRITSDLTPPSEDDECEGAMPYGSRKGSKMQDGGREEDGTMIGVEATGSHDQEMKMVVGKVEPSESTPLGRSVIADAVDCFFDDTDDDEMETSTNDTDKASDSPSLRSKARPVSAAKILANMTPRRLRVRSGSGAPPKAAGAAEDTASAVRSSSASVRKRKAMLVRMGTYMFNEYRQREMDEGRGGVLPGTWSKMAIVRIHRKPEPKIRECSCMGVTHTLRSSRRSETGRIADLEEGSEGGTVPLRTYGPYRSAYGRLCEFPHLPPILIVATGAGAALALDFVGYVRANNLVPLRPVTVCYSSASLPLLQFVTNTLLAERTHGIEIKTALTRHDDLELFDTTGAQAQKELEMGRLDVEGIISSVPVDTEVYFCGGGAVNALLRKKCASRGLSYVGSSVQ